MDLKWLLLVGAGVVIKTALASQISLSNLYAYNVERCSTSNLTGTTKMLKMQNMKHHTNQQVPQISVEMREDKQAQIRIKNGGQIFVFRGSDLIFPNVDELHCAVNILPRLNISRKVPLEAGDSIIFICPDETWPVKPIDLVGSFSHAGEINEDFFPPFIKNFKKKGDFSLIIGSVVEDTDKSDVRVHIIDPTRKVVKKTKARASSSSSLSLSLSSSPRTRPQIPQRPLLITQPIQNPGFVHRFLEDLLSHKSSSSN